MKQDARYALILESLAEFNARLRILDEANARLEAAVERQLELLETFVTQREQLFTLLQNQMAGPASMEVTERKTQEARQAAAGSRSQADRDSRILDTQPNRFVDHGTEYSRETHPALFKVVDLLEQDEQAHGWSVRQLAHQTGVSKSWCAIARRYMLREETVH